MVLTSQNPDVSLTFFVKLSALVLIAVDLLAKRIFFCH